MSDRPTAYDPYDADRPLRLGCACGRHASAADHDADHRGGGAAAGAAGAELAVPRIARRAGDHRIGEPELEQKRAEDVAVAVDHALDIAAQFEGRIAGFLQRDQSQRTQTNISPSAVHSSAELPVAFVRSRQFQEQPIAIVVTPGFLEVSNLQWREPAHDHPSCSAPTITPTLQGGFGGIIENNIRT